MFPYASDYVYTPGMNELTQTLGEVSLFSSGRPPIEDNYPNSPCCLYAWVAKLANMRQVYVMFFNHTHRLYDLLIKIFMPDVIFWAIA